MLIGIDAAKWQGILPVHALADAGIAFAIVKATNGLGPTDPQFAASWAALGHSTLIRGAYHWFTDSDPELQANHFVRSVGDLRDEDLPLAVDFEEPSTKFRGNELLDRLRRCLARVRELTGRPVLLYTGAWYWAGYAGNLDAPDIVERCPLWHAQYPRLEVRDRKACGLQPPNLPAPTLPRPWASRGVREAIWQFDGDGGYVLPNGVDADFNQFRGTIEDLRALCAERVAPDTLPSPPLVPSVTRPDAPQSLYPVEVPNALDFVATLADPEEPDVS